MTNSTVSERKYNFLNTILWMLFALVVLILFVEPLTSVLERATKVKVADFIEIESQLDSATKMLPPEYTEKSKIKLPHSLLERYSKVINKEKSVKVLIAHDKRATANKIRLALGELGFSSDIGICPTEIKNLLSRHEYDVVISDVKWKKCSNSELPNNGIKFLQYAHSLKINQPTVFFITNYAPSKGTPAYAKGITNDWYEILHLIFDILERKNA